MEKSGHFGGSLLLYFGILYAAGWRGDTVETLGLALIAAIVATCMSVKQDADNFAWGIFHRTWVTHSLATVLVVTGVTYIVFADLLHAGPLTMYMTIAMLSATLSHVLLDSLTKGGVPLFGPFDDKKWGLRWFKGSSVLLNWAFMTAGLAMAAIYFGLVRPW